MRTSAVAVVAISLLAAFVSVNVAQDASRSPAASMPAGASGTAAGPPSAATKAASGAAVLDTYSYWRMHGELKAPVIQTDSGAQPIEMGDKICGGFQSPAAPAGWAQPDFDDANWVKAPALRNASSPLLARLCLRGKFRVTDAASVKDLRLNVAYHGGIIVYMNGKEIGRRHLPHGGDGLAEAYPAETFLNKDGKPYGFSAFARLPENDPKRLLPRRSLEAAVPSSLLREGTNVVAVEIIRAPYPNDVEIPVDPKSYLAKTWNNRYRMGVHTCHLVSIRLSAGSNDGLAANVSRPEGLQVWNTSLLHCDRDVDWGDPTDPRRPIEIVGPRNGMVSGKVAVGSTQPIRGLKAAAGALKGPGGEIPSSAVQVRYGFPWGDEYAWEPWNPGRPYPTESATLAGFSEKPLEEYPIAPKRASKVPPTEALPVTGGAVVPILVTVHVPKDAKPGEYTGELAIEAGGAKAAAVPIRLKVADWTLPDTQDYRTVIEIIQSPETLAEEYKVPLWSEEHWRLIARSMDLLRASGSRSIWLPLICETNFGHAQTLVQWVKKGEGRYEHDFSLLDRYLDTAIRHMGKPKAVVLYAWETYLIAKDRPNTGGLGEKLLMEAHEKKGVLTDHGPAVTVLDPASGKRETVQLTRYEDPNSAALWKPVYEGVLKRLADRGLDGAAAFGMMTDAWPTKKEVEFLHSMAPRLPWCFHGHICTNPTAYDITAMGPRSMVWLLSAAGQKSLMGWKRPDRLVRFVYNSDFSRKPQTAWRGYAEFGITGDQRGVGRLGGDYWQAVRDKQGRRSGFVAQRYPQSTWRHLDTSTTLLCPSPEGAAATLAYVNFCENVQECEARIFLEDALITASKRDQLPEYLAGRCQVLLDERLRAVQITRGHLLACTGGEGGGTLSAEGHMWFMGSGWQERSERLFALAGEVAKTLQAR